MRRSFGFAALFLAACGSGGPLDISTPVRSEISTILGPQFEAGRVRMSERARAGLVSSEVVVAAEDLRSRCVDICEIAGPCIGSTSIARCSANCFVELSAGPVGCAIPVLDALLCAVSAVCFLPTDQVIRSEERILSCGIEIGEASSVQPGYLPGVETCDLIDF